MDACVVRGPFEVRHGLSLETHAETAGKCRSLLADNVFLPLSLGRDKVKSLETRKLSLVSRDYPNSAEQQHVVGDEIRRRGGDVLSVLFDVILFTCAAHKLTS